jgi:hypothetical protein
VNDIVAWTNGDIFRHTASATDGSFDIDLPAGATGQNFEANQRRDLHLPLPSRDERPAGRGTLTTSEGCKVRHHRPNIIFERLRRPAEFRTFLWYCKLCERKVSHTVGVGWNIKNKVVR